MHAREPISDREQKIVALGYLQEAWAEARLDGIDGDCLRKLACSLHWQNLSPPMVKKLRQISPMADARIRNGEFRSISRGNSRQK